MRGAKIRNVSRKQNRWCSRNRRALQMENSKDDMRHKLELAEIVRRTCVEAAVEGYERAGMSGLCREGAWEAAISAMSMVDLTALLNSVDEDSARPGPAEVRPQLGKLWMYLGSIVLRRSTSKRPFTCSSRMARSGRLPPIALQHSCIT